MSSRTLIISHALADYHPQWQIDARRVNSELEQLLTF